MWNSKIIEICSNLHAGLLRFLFIEDSLKIKGLGTSFQVTFFVKFFDKNFLL